MELCKKEGLREKDWRCYTVFEDGHHSMREERIIFLLVIILLNFVAFHVTQCIELKCLFL